MVLGPDILTCPDIADQITQGLLLEQLGKQSWPVGLNGHSSCLNHGLQVLRLQEFHVSFADDTLS